MLVPGMYLLVIVRRQCQGAQTLGLTPPVSRIRFPHCGSRHWWEMPETRPRPLKSYGPGAFDSRCGLPRKEEYGASSRSTLGRWPPAVTRIGHLSRGSRHHVRSGADGPCQELLVASSGCVVLGGFLLFFVATTSSAFPADPENCRVSGARVSRACLRVIYVYFQSNPTVPYTKFSNSTGRFDPNSNFRIRE